MLEADCKVKPELLTVSNINSLKQLEPCGNGCAKPVLVTEGLTVEKISQVGSGRHMRVRLRSGWHVLQGIWFSSTAQSASIAEGDTVDVAYNPQINEYRGEKTAQLNILDIRPSCKEACDLDMADYRAMRRGELGSAGAARLLPDRSVQEMVWKYLYACPGESITEEPGCLCRKLVRWSGMPLSLGKMLICLDIFADVGLLQIQRLRKNMTIRLVPAPCKADLQESRTLQMLQKLKESE